MKQRLLFGFALVSMFFNLYRLPAALLPWHESKAIFVTCAMAEENGDKDAAEDEAKKDESDKDKDKEKGQSGGEDRKDGQYRSGSQKILQY
ncbi:MAG: hypothetical protein AB1568_11330 [Thermodesulfobacteriota bacterium]